MDDLRATPAPDRLSQLSVGERSNVTANPLYTRIIRSLRFILPLAALVMIVVVVTWDEGGRVEPMSKKELMPAYDKAQNELLKPVFNSIDDKNQPYSVTADRAIQNKENPDIVELDKPQADLAMNDGGKISAQATSGLYEQKTQKLNLEGAVELSHSNGYKLETEELRVDAATQKAYSGRAVHIDGPAGSLDASGLESDAKTGAVIFTGPAKVILYSNGDMLSPQEGTP